MQHRLKMKLRFADEEDTVSRITKTMFAVTFVTKKRNIETM